MIEELESKENLYLRYGTSDGALETQNFMKDSPFFFLENHIICINHILHNSIKSFLAKNEDLAKININFRYISTYFRGSSKRMGEL